MVTHCSRPPIEAYSSSSTALCDGAGKDRSLARTRPPQVPTDSHVIMAVMIIFTHFTSMFPSDTIHFAAGSSVPLALTAFIYSVNTCTSCDDFVASEEP